MRGLRGSVTVVALIAAAYATTNEAQEVVLPDYAAQLADLPSPPNDRSLPAVSPDGPVGAYGFSRYVYQRQGDDIVATLIEGPEHLLGPDCEHGHSCHGPWCWPGIQP